MRARNQLILNRIIIAASILLICLSLVFYAFDLYEGLAIYMLFGGMLFIIASSISSSISKKKERNRLNK